MFFFSHARVYYKNRCYRCSVYIKIPYLCGFLLNTFVNTFSKKVFSFAKRCSVFPLFRLKIDISEIVISFIKVKIRDIVHTIEPSALVVSFLPLFI
nr:MAG TPA: hypothetical protein [Caudoviricetes sp.]